MPLLREETYTIEDIYALPEGERAELIDWHIYYMAPPSRKHQDISMELSSVIKDYIPRDADAQLEESERIKAQILQMENDMWN